MTSTAQKILIGVAIVAAPFVFVIAVLCGASVYGWRAAERAGNEAATIQNLKTIATVESEYFENNKSFASFDRLVKEQQLSSKFNGNPPEADGYVFNLKTSASSYVLTADPVSKSTGKNHFYIDSSSTRIRINPTARAGPNDPLF